MRTNHVLLMESQTGRDDNYIRKIGCQLLSLCERRGQGFQHYAMVRVEAILFFYTTRTSKSTRTYSTNMCLVFMVNYFFSMSVLDDRLYESQDQVGSIFRRCL
jgi:hypothetical protein